MTKTLFFILLYLLSLNLYFSQNSNNFDYMFEGEVKLENAVELVSPIGNIDSGLFVELKINDIGYKFLVDTGASVSVLNDQVFKNISNPIQKIKIQDAVGNEEEKDLLFIDFRIGNNKFSNFAFVKYDLSNFYKDNFCSKFDGILGANILKKLNWKFSKVENKIFFSKNTFPYEGYNAPSKIQWFGSIPIVELTMNQNKFLAIIDTGHFGTLIIPDYVFINSYGFGTFYNLIKGRGEPITTVKGRQKLEIKKAQIQNFSLDNYDFSKYEVLLTKNVKPNIGNTILLEDGFIFNFLNNEISFGISKKEKQHAPLAKIKICKSETNKNQLELCFFWDETANKALKLKDQIIQIDDINTTNIDEKEYCTIMEYVNNNIGSKKITFKRGKKIFVYDAS